MRFALLVALDVKRNSNYDSASAWGFDAHGNRLAWSHGTPLHR